MLGHLGIGQLCFVARRNGEGMVCGAGKARMTNSSPAVTLKGLSKHLQCLVLGVLNANTSPAAWESTFPPGEPSLGVQPEEAELEVRHQGGSSAALPAPSCLPAFLVERNSSLN